MKKKTGSKWKEAPPLPHVDLEQFFEAIHYREFKILLKPEAFSGDIATDVHDYWKLARRLAGQLLIHVSREKDEDKPRVREIIFLDTPKSDLYQRSFLLRTRRDVPDGKPAPSCELTLKFRSPDVQAAAEANVEPVKGISGRLKFKEELLLVVSALGGMRSTYSHTCQIREWDRPLPKTIGEAAKLFPALGKLGLASTTPLRPASKVGVEEVLYELGTLGFAGPKVAKVSMALWRTIADKKPLIGEFAYEPQFRHYGRLDPAGKSRSERLYRLLQRETGGWVELGTTKTAVYYALSGKPVARSE